MVMESPTARPCATAVTMVTELPDSVAPVGASAMGCVKVSLCVTALVPSLARLVSASLWSKRYSKAPMPPGSLPAPTMPTLTCSCVGAFHSTPWMMRLAGVQLAEVLDDRKRVVA